MTLANLIKNNVLIFIHIPKCAGITLRTIFRNNIPRRNIRETGPGKNRMGTPEEMTSVIKNLPDADKNAIGLVAGHVKYGIHRCFPKGAIYFKLLRNPVDRITSFYYYVLRKPEHKLHEYIVNKQITLEDFVTQSQIEVTNNTNNAMTWQLTEIERDNSTLSVYDAYKLAVKNVEDENFLCCGITEMFDEFLILLKRKLGLANIFYEKSNVGTNRKTKEEIKNEVKNAILSHNEVDLRLYEYVKNKFMEEIRQKGYSFQIELLVFKTINKLRASPEVDVNSNEMKLISNLFSTGEFRKSGSVVCNFIDKHFKYTRPDLWEFSKKLERVLYLSETTTLEETKRNARPEIQHTGHL